MRQTPLLLVVSSLLIGPVVVADSSLPAPEEAVSFWINSEQVYIAWLPPSQGTASTYRVYGYDDGNRVRLNETALLAAAVPGGYDSYVVVAVYGLSESSEEVADSCIRINSPGHIPPAVVDITCLPP